MRKVITISLLLVGLLAFMALSLAAQDAKKEEAKKEAAFEYVGAAKCKGCHKEVHTSWMETKHVKAFDILSDEEKKKEECVGCHSTGKMADGTLIGGVECEACHGPGSAYKSMKIMSKKKWAADPEAQKKLAIEAGLLYPGDKDCRVCHRKEGNVNFKEFNFEKSMPLVHALPSKAKTE